jgi:DNA-binding transcriptional regulator YiaG
MGSIKREWIVSGRESAALRKATGMSQAKIAKLLGIGVGTVGNWEIGRRPTPKWAVLLYKILAAKRQALITGRPGDVDLG